jgi:predicted transcriptional regulator
MAERPPRLGTLEGRVLEWLWGREWVDVRAAHAAHASERRRSPKTLHSTLERLVRKGLVERRRDGRAYSYRAIVSQQVFVGRALEGAIEQMPGTDSRSVLAAFVDVAARMDEAGLDELERLVAHRRRARDRGGQKS